MVYELELPKREVAPISLPPVGGAWLEEIRSYWTRCAGERGAVAACTQRAVIEALQSLAAQH